MKKIFRKAVTVLGSTVLIGATVAMAAAASYPEPFTSNAAIVVGANAAPSDNIAASSIASNLDANAVGGAVTITDGDSYKFEKSSTKFHLGDSFTTLRTNLNDEHLTTLLADGKYTDDDNDEFDYSQKIVMSSTPTLALFEDSDYKDDIPTIGFRTASSAAILNYTLTFSDTPLFSDLKTTTLPLMGKEYYVLDNGTSIVDGAKKLTLLDAAADAIVAEGESTTISAGGKTYTISIEFVDSDSAKLNVNGEITNDIEESQTYKLDDGSYLGMKEILYSAKDTGISKVEFSIGSGKLILTDTSEVELNEETITGLTAYIGNSTTKLSSITLEWKGDDELFITEDNSVTMPGFGAVSLSYTGINYPAEEEIKIDVSNNEFTLSNFPLDDGTADIQLYYINETSGNFSGYGKDSTNQLLISSGSSILYNADDVHEYFIASWNDTTDSASYLMRATSFITESSTVNKTTIQYKKDGSWVDAKTKAQPLDEVTLGDLTLTVGAIDKNAKTVNLTGSTGVSFNRLYSKEGMAITLGLEADAATTTFAGNNISTMTLTFAEEDKNDNLAAGDSFTVTLGAGGSTTKTASVTGLGALDGDSKEIDNTDVYQEFAHSALATETLYDKGDTAAKKLSVIYHGSEVTADVYITSADAVSTSGDAGVMTVMDSAVASVAGKNLVVVGGSAINSVAAELLGGALSEGAFTSATGVGADEFLIQSFSRSGKTALLVAGYNAADTEKAVTYLLNNDVDTTVGTKMKGTSATEATVVTA